MPTMMKQALPPLEPDMSTHVRMICPNLKCRSILSVPTNARGKTVRCRQCSMRIHVPAPVVKKPTPVPPPPAPAGGEAT